MSCFKVRIDGVVTGATANVFSTIAALTFPNTAGYRGRLRSLTVAGAGGAVQDVQVSLRLRRTDNTTTGTSTAVNVNTIGKADPLSRASFVSAAGKNFTVEPTNYETGSLGLGAVNARNTFIKEWGPEEAPRWGSNQMLGLEAAPGIAAAVTLDLTFEWDEE